MIRLKVTCKHNFHLNTLNREFKDGQIFDVTSEQFNNSDIKLVVSKNWVEVLSDGSKGSTTLLLDDNADEVDIKPASIHSVKTITDSQKKDVLSKNVPDGTYINTNALKPNKHKTIKPVGKPKTLQNAQNLANLIGTSFEDLGVELGDMLSPTEITKLDDTKDYSFGPKIEKFMPNNNFLYDDFNNIDLEED